MASQKGCPGKGLPSTTLTHRTYVNVDISSSLDGSGRSSLVKTHTQHSLGSQPHTFSHPSRCMAPLCIQHSLPRSLSTYMTLLFAQHPNCNHPTSASHVISRNCSSPWTALPHLHADAETAPCSYPSLLAHSTPSYAYKQGFGSLAWCSAAEHSLLVHGTFSLDSSRRAHASRVQEIPSL